MITDFWDFLEPSVKNVITIRRVGLCKGFKNNLTEECCCSRQALVRVPHPSQEASLEGCPGGSDLALLGSQ